MLISSYYSAIVGVRTAEYCGQSVCVCVCLSVCLQAYLWNHWSYLHQVFCACPLWPWIGAALTALRYVMYFRFVDDVTFGLNESYGMAEFDVYKCLVDLM